MIVRRFVCLVALCAGAACMKTPPPHSQSTGSQCVPVKDDCSYYQCQTAVSTCEYWEYYGAKYCERFGRMCNDQLNSPNARAWVAGTMRCLQESLAANPGVQNDCDTLDDFAFDSHPYCYTKGAYERAGVGFCDLSTAEVITIAGCVDTKDQLALRAVKQMIATARICAAYYLGGSYYNKSTESLVTKGLVQTPEAPLDANAREKRGREFLRVANEIEQMIETQAPR